MGQTRALKICNQKTSTRCEVAKLIAVDLLKPPGEGDPLRM